jgi:hypothetical protein
MTIVPISKTPQPDPLRLQLAQAVAALAAAERAVVAHRSAIDRGFDTVAAAETKLDTARANVVEARQTDIRDAAERIKTQAGDGATRATRAARAAEQSAEDDLHIAREALDQLQRVDLVDLQTAALWRKNDLNIAIQSLLLPVATTLLNDIHKTRVKLGADQNALELLLAVAWTDTPKFPSATDLGQADGAAREQRLAVMQEVRSAVERLAYTKLGKMPDELAEIGKISGAWFQTIDGLKRGDVNAPLPEL